MRYRNLFLAFLTANAATLLSFYGCELKSGGTGTGGGVDPGSDAGFDASKGDAGPGGDCPGVNTQTDPNNCGACGHSCQGDKCSAGLCEVVVFSRVPVAPSGYATEIALDQNGVVVTVGTDTGAVYNVPFDADGGYIPVAQSQVQPRGPSTKGNYVCWGVFGDNRVRCSQRDGLALVEANDNVGGSPTSTAILGFDAYWVFNAGSEIRRFPLDGGTNKATTVASYQGGAIAGGRSLAIDGNRFVWIVREAKAVVIAAADGAPIVEATTLGRTTPAFPSALAIGQDGYYVVAENNPPDIGGLYRVSKTGTGGNATPLVRQSLVNPYIAIDQQYVYYTDRTGGNIYRFPLNATVPEGGVQVGPNGAVPDGAPGPQLIVKGQTNPTAIAVTDKHVYWISSGPQSGLMRVAK